MIFKTAHIDTPAFITTIFVCIALIGLGLLFLIKVPLGWAFAAGMALIPVCTYLLAPRFYSVEPDRLIIQKNISTKIVVLLSDIIAYSIIPDLRSLHISRTLGNGGLFGYYGIFSTAEYGEINCQLTSLKNIVLLKTKIGYYAVSPEHASQFASYLTSAAPHVNTPVKELEPLSAQLTNRPSPAILLIPIVLFCLTIILMICAYNTMPERIAVHFDVHGIPDRYGPRLSYLISTAVPATILLLIACAAFFIVRRTTRNKAIPIFLVLIVSLMQLFAGYTSLDTYWVTHYNHHVLPITYAIVIFVVLMVSMLFYYQRIVKRTPIFSSSGDDFGKVGGNNKSY
jgi:hypothetical protein